MERPRAGLIGMMPGWLQPAAVRGMSYVSGLPRSGQVIWINDLWPGDPERGKRIVNRRFTLAGGDIALSSQTGWYAKEATLPWLRALHGFGWMRDVCAYHDPRQSAKRLRLFVEDWLNARSAQHPVAMEPAVAGERLANWITYAMFLTRGSNPSFQRKFLRYLQTLALKLRRQILRGEQQADQQLAAIKGVMLAALLLPNCRFLYHDARVRLDYYLAELQDMGNKPEGRNPAYLHETLRHVIEIQEAYRLVLGEEDAILEPVIHDLALLVKNLLHGDGGFALFNGATEGVASDIAHTLKQAGTESGPLPERSGFARIDAGESCVILDAAPADYTRKLAYYGTLAFEWSANGRRMVVNCGAFEGEDAAWSRVVRTSAAHSTLCLDDRNSCQFTHGLPAKHPFTGGEAEPHVERRGAQQDGYHFFEAVYNGYMPYAGLCHSRQLLINEAGTRFSGADHLLLVDGYQDARSHDVNLRFHLHPDVQARRLMNGMIILHIPGVAGEWTFQSSVGQAAELDESIYLGKDGKPAGSQQIVIYAPYNPDVHGKATPWAVEWSFIKSA